MRKKRVHVTSYPRKPYTRKGTYIKPKRTIEHFRNAIVETEKSIRQGIQKEKQSRKELEKALEQAKNRQQRELEEAIQQKHVKRISDLQKEREILDAETALLSSEANKIKEFQDKREQLARHLYKKDSPLSRKMGFLYRKKEHDKLVNEILRAKIQTRQNIENLIQTRANTINSLRKSAQAISAAESKEALDRVQIAQQTRTVLPSPVALTKLFSQPFAKTSEAVGELIRKKAGEPDLGMFSEEDLFKLVSAGRIPLSVATSELRKRTRQGIALGIPAPPPKPVPVPLNLYEKLHKKERYKQKAFTIQGKRVMFPIEMVPASIALMKDPQKAEKAMLKDIGRHRPLHADIPKDIHTSILMEATKKKVTPTQTTAYKQFWKKVGTRK